MTKRVGLYGRVSDRQQADNTSIEGQWSRGRTFALEHGFEIVAEKAEVITGASRWGARTVFNEYLEMADQGLLDGIVVDVPDRLGRGRALATLLDRAERHGLEVFFANGEEIDSVSLGVAIITSGKEREDIGRRTRQGKLRTVERGGIVFAQAAYGYQIIREYDPNTGKKIGATVEFEPTEIQHATNMYHWLVNERESLHGIRVRLYEDKVLPPSLKKKYGTWEAVPEGVSKLWHRATIRNILSNEVYVGRWWYNKVQTKRVEDGDRMKQVRLGERDKGEWVYVEVPAAISEELFKEAQAILRKNQRQLVGRPSKNNQYLLKGLLFCPCGWRMIGVTYRSGNGAYRCKRDVTRVERECDAPRLNQQLVEDLVWNYIEGLLLNPEALIAGYEERQKEIEKENAILLERAEVLQADIHKAEVKLDNLLDLFLAKEIDRQTYKRKKREIEDDIKDTRLELARVQAQLEREPFTEDHKAQLLAFCEEVQGGLEIATFEDKRHLLLMLDVKIKHLPDEEAVKVEGAFPDTKLSITS